MMSRLTQRAIRLSLTRSTKTSLLPHVGAVALLAMFAFHESNTSQCNSYSQLPQQNHFSQPNPSVSFIADAVEKAIPALVNIMVTQNAGRGYLIAQSSGSGFVIDANGLIATNAHVVKNASSITITLNDGSVLKGRVHSSDAVSDLALVMVDEPLEQPLPTMEIGEFNSYHFETSCFEVNYFRRFFSSSAG